jgi:hypothetical protein
MQRPEMGLFSGHLVDMTALLSESKWHPTSASPPPCAPREGDSRRQEAQLKPLVFPLPAPPPSPCFPLWGG